MRELTGIWESVPRLLARFVGGHLREGKYNKILANCEVKMVTAYAKKR